MLEKKVFVKDLKDGDLVEDIFFFLGKKENEIFVFDATGKLTIIFEEEIPFFSKKEPIFVKGVFRDNKVFAEYVGKVEEELDYFSFLPFVEGYENYLKRFNYFVSQLSEEARKDVECFLDSEDGKLFLLIPAGKRIHHIYKGGLLKHVVEMLEIGERILSLGYDVDKDVLYLGIIFHDVGKIKTISISNGFVEYTKEGNLLPHTSLGVCLAEKYLRNISKEKKVMVLHVVESHMGKQENGSAIEPKTKEAFVVHFLDQISWVLNMFENLEKEKEGNFFFSPVDRWLFIEKKKEKSNL